MPKKDDLGAIVKMLEYVASELRNQKLGEEARVLEDLLVSLNINILKSLNNNQIN